MMEMAYPALKGIKFLGCLTHTPCYENAIDVTQQPYRAPLLLFDKNVARTCTSLILAQCEIEELPELIGMYYLLRHLDVSENRLNELPPDVGSCYSLRVLNFSSNQIKVIPDEIQQLVYLEKLQCYSNKIVNIPDWLGNMPLEELNVFNNKVLKISPALGKLKLVTEMNLAANVIMQLPYESIEEWTSVSVLNVFECRLMKMGSIGHMQQLEEVRLFNNNLSEMPDFGKDGLPNLRILELNKNNITELTLDSFRGLENLEKLVLSNNQISAIPSGINCPKLEHLLLASNQLSAVPPDLPLMPSLKVVFLNSNQLLQLPETFMQNKKLQRVNLSMNSKLKNTSLHILAHIKRTCDTNKGQYWSPDTLQR